MFNLITLISSSICSHGSTCVLAMRWVGVFFGSRLHITQGRELFTNIICNKSRGQRRTFHFVITRRSFPDVGQLMHGLPSPCPSFNSSWLLHDPGCSLAAELRDAHEARCSSMGRTRCCRRTTSSLKTVLWKGLADPDVLQSPAALKLPLKNGLTSGGAQSSCSHFLQHVQKQRPVL